MKHLPLSNLKKIYNKHDYSAYIHTPSETVVVYRGIDKGGYTLGAHVGEKHKSQDWREVMLFGCPHHIRMEIISAWKMESQS